MGRPRSVTTRCSPARTRRSNSLVRFFRSRTDAVTPDVAAMATWGSLAERRIAVGRHWPQRLLAAGLCSVSAIEKSEDEIPLACVGRNGVKLAALREAVRIHALRRAGEPP